VSWILDPKYGNVFQICASIYIYLVIGFNRFELLLFAENAIRTKGGKDSSPFDYADLAHMAIASSSCGNELAESMKDSVTETDEHRCSDMERGRFVGYSLP
jgi:hypothetical protein